MAIPHPKCTLFPQEVYTHSTDSVLIEQLQLRIQERDETIADLRSRLDASQAQVSQLSAVIAQLQPPQAKRGWWAKAIGWSIGIHTYAMHKIGLWKASVRWQREVLFNEPILSRR